MNRRYQGLVCLTYVALSLMYNALTPIGESPDEIGHFEYVRLVADRGRMPGAGDALWQGHQSPLYYGLEATWTLTLQALSGCRIARDDLPSRDNPGFPNLPNLNRFVHAGSERIDGWTCSIASFHLLRVLSTALTVPLILLTFGILRAAMPGAPHVAASAGTIAALLPSHVAISSMLNNDSLVNLIIVATTYLVVAATTRGDATALARATLLAVVGTTAKLSALYLLGLVAMGLLWRRELASALFRERRARAWLVAAGVGAILPIPILERNLLEWGDPFAVGALENNLLQLKAVGVYLPPPGMPRYYFVELPRVFIESLPVAFGSINFPLWEYFALTRWAMFTTVAGVLLSGMVRDRWRFVERTPVALLATGYVLFLATYLFPGYRYRWLQVRYFFGQLPLLSMVMAIGLFTIWDLPRRLGVRVPDSVLVAILYAALLALNLVVLSEGVFGHLYQHVGTIP